jgi:hypothetical protein
MRSSWLIYSTLMADFDPAWKMQAREVGAETMVTPWGDL